MNAQKAFMKLASINTFRDKSSWMPMSMLHSRLLLSIRSCRGRHTDKKSNIVSIPYVGSEHFKSKSRKEVGVENCSPGKQSLA